MRLIDADELPRFGHRGGLVHWKDIENAPTIDAVQVVQGEWKPFDQTFGREIWYCTACETSMHMPTEMGKPMYKYCPMCGARMKGEDDE